MRGEAHFSARPSTRATVESITRDDLVAFHGRYYHPGNFIVAVSGDVETDDILKRLEGQLADWPIKPETVPTVPAPSHEPPPWHLCGRQTRCKPGPCLDRAPWNDP